MSMKDVGIESKKECEARTGTNWSQEEYNRYVDEMERAMRPGAD